MRVERTKVEHMEQRGSPALHVVFASFAHMMRHVVQSKTSHHSLHEHSRREMFWADSAWERSWRQSLIIGRFSRLLTPRRRILFT